MVLKWGIAGSGKICHDFVSALKSISNYHQVIAVGARSQKSANDFAQKHNIKKSYKGYKALAQDDDIGN